MIKKFFIGILLFVLGIFVLFFSFWLSLPEQKITYAINRYLSQKLPHQKVLVRNVSSTLSGFEIESFSVHSPTLETYLNLREFRVNFLSFRLFSGKILFSGGVRAKELTGTFSLFSEHIDGKITNLPLNISPYLKSLNLFSEDPLLNADYHYNLKGNSMNFNFNLRPLVMNHESASWEGVRSFLPQSFSLRLLEGRVSSESPNNYRVKINFTGDFNGVLEGTVALSAQAPNNPIFNLRLSGKFSQKFAEQEFSNQSGIFQGLISEYLKNNAVNITIRGNLQNGVQINNI